MPKGAVRRVRDVIAGLLVLTVLLFSGPEPSIAVVAGAHHHDADVAGLTVAAIGHGVATPFSDSDHDHGLPCCIGGQCTVHAYWLPVQRTKLPYVSQIAVASPPSRERLLAGIFTEPTSPPPRPAV